MVSRKPDRDVYISFVHALIDDVSISNGRKNTSFDKLTILARTVREGIGFLTKTLPKLGSSLDTALKTGLFVCPTNFRRYKQSALPSFLKGLLLRIFEKNGRLLEEPDVAAICEVRQICYSLYKLVVPFTDDQLRTASAKFIEVDNQLPDSLQSVSKDTETVLRLGAEFLRDLFRGFDPYDIVPSHGPGIVASGEKPHEKRIFSTKYRNIHNEYPYYRFFYVNSSHLRACSHFYWLRNVEDAGINKVLFVPKDSRGPRTIACEPLEYQFIQQGLRKKIYAHVERHPLTSGKVSFSDQSINQTLSWIGSNYDPTIVTLDLKDASDSVSVALVDRLFCLTPLLKPLLALRTDRSLLPTGETVNLKKYAAMGSALCFPVEALVFYALLVGVQALYERLAPFGSVYGDDIILHSDLVPTYVEILSEVGLKVNTAKSCTTGLFRESCGAEWWNGHDVTYQKCRTIDVVDPANLASVVETSNLLFDRGYYKAAKCLEDLARSAVPDLPFGLEDSGYLCLWSSRWSSFPSGKTRWNNELQQNERRVPYLQGTTYQVDNHDDEILEEYAEYYRKLTQGWSDRFRAGSYAERRVKLKRKYVLSTR